VVSTKTFSSAASRPALATIALAAGVLAMSAGLTAAAPPPAPSSTEGAVTARRVVVAADEVTRPITADEAPGLFARAAAVRDALGFRVGSTRGGKHVVDRSHGDEYDAVSETDASGGTLSEVRFGAGGRFEVAVRLDRIGMVDRGITPAKAAVLARKSLASLALAPAGAEAVASDEVQGGWQIHWARTQRGVAVRGDETRVHVRADGSIGSVTSVEHELAPEPARRLARDAAFRVAEARGVSWFAGTESGYRIESATIQWVEPNGLFDPAVPMEGAGPYRLAWVVNVKPTGPAALSVALITLFVDAGTGSVIGGDVVQ
jgi:hypothetical protein